MKTVGFRPGYTMQGSESKLRHDPGMDAVRTLGVLVRLVAYPAPILSEMEMAVRASANCYYRLNGFNIYRTPYPCVVIVTARQAGAHLPENLQTDKDLLHLLRARHLGEPVLATLGHKVGARDQAWVYYDTMRESYAVIAELDGATIDNVQLQAKLSWNRNPV